MEIRDRGDAGTCDRSLEDRERQGSRYDFAIRWHYAAIANSELHDPNQKTSLTSKVSILKRIVNMTYSDGDDMERHLHEMEDLFQRLSNAGIEL